MIPVAVVALLPASYLGVTAALDHLTGGPGSPLADCVSSGCGSTVLSPEAAGAPTAPASQATHPGAAVRTSAQHTAARPSATASRPGWGTDPLPSVTSPRPSPRTSRPRPARTATPPPAAPAPLRRPQAAVSYQPDQRWPGGFTGQFGIVNEGQRPIGNWRLAVTLPGDDVRDVQGADWSTSGDTLTMQPPHSAGPLEPGSSLTISIVAFGNTDTPTSCSLNGHTCHP